MISALRTAIRLLFFRITREEILGFDNRHLAIGLLFTWIVGMGRHWDHADVSLTAKLGLHSVGYVFVLSVLLWTIARPFSASGWTYRRVLIYVMLTAPPGFIYAIPVERLFSFDEAYMMNLYFLLGVSIWRVALWFQLLHTFGKLHILQTVIVALLPLAAISTYAAITGKALSLFVTAMAGNRVVEIGDGVKEFMIHLATISFYGLVVLIPAYVVLIVHHLESRAATSNQVEPPINTDEH